MITLARRRRIALIPDSTCPAKLRSKTLKAIKSYRKFIRWANRWEARLDPVKLTAEDLDRDAAATLDRLHRLERAAIDGIRAYAAATGQRGDRPCVIDDRGDVIAYMPELVADATLEYESVFATIPTARIMPR